MAGEGWPSLVIGFGFFSLEAHALTYQGGFDVDVYVNSGLGRLGVNLQFLEDEDAG